MLPNFAPLNFVGTNWKISPKFASLNFVRTDWMMPPISNTILLPIVVQVYEFPWKIGNIEKDKALNHHWEH